MPTILLYHGVPRHADCGLVDVDSFERHVRFLKRHYRIVDPPAQGRTNEASCRIAVTLTFDDGFCNNAEVVAPILKRHSVPALFFISSRHAETGRYLWFSYLKALEAHFPHRSFAFRGEAVDMNPAARRESMQRLRRALLDMRPHPSVMYSAIDNELPRLEDFIDKDVLRDHYQGMTAEQIAELCVDPLFTAGVHTVDHVFLTRCSRKEAERQLRENKAWLERCSSRECRSVAYPSGDYDHSTIDLCKLVGLSEGYAVSPSLRAHSRFEVPRVGVYCASIPKLAVKATFGNAMRRMRLNVG
jgi:peptidoglycan/xylan/chitin deacetylase (PgdA/CDA1 family)